LISSDRPEHRQLAVLPGGAVSPVPPAKGGQIAKYFLIRRPRQNTADARTDFNVIGA
jgi:hypothetical protein